MKTTQWNHPRLRHQASRAGRWVFLAAGWLVFALNPACVTQQQTESPAEGSGTYGHLSAAAELDTTSPDAPPDPEGDTDPGSPDPSPCDDPAVGASAGYPKVYEDSASQCASGCTQSFDEFCDADGDGQTDPDKAGVGVVLCSNAVPCLSDGTGGEPATCLCDPNGSNGLCAEVEACGNGNCSPYCGECEACPADCGTVMGQDMCQESNPEPPPCDDPAVAGSAGYPKVYEGSPSLCASGCTQSYDQFCDGDGDGLTDPDKAGVGVTLCTNANPCLMDGTGGTPAVCSCSVTDTCGEFEPCGNGYCAPYCGECDGCPADCGTVMGQEMCQDYNPDPEPECSNDTDCDDNNPCTGVESCNATGECQPGTPITCGDGDGCTTGDEVCDPATGLCAPGTPADCDDGNLCTTDACEYGTCGGGPGCAAMPPTSSFPGYDFSTCDASVGPGSSCAAMDALQACLLQACLDGCGGKCSVVTTGNGWSCDGGSDVRPEGYYACDCYTGTAPTSPCDGTPAPSGCSAGGPCGDADCDGNDDCDGSPSTCTEVICGECTHTPVDCSNGVHCDGAEYCDPADGSCQNAPPPVCDNGDPCDGVETCDEASKGCASGPAINCDDGAFCSGVETCNPSDGSCIPGVSPCDDNDFCTGVETCDESADTCGDGPDPVCDDSLDCTDDSCDPQAGCVFTPTDTGCTCNGAPGNFNFGVSTTLFEATRGCPGFLSGNVAGEVSLSGSVTYTEPHCSNDCKQTAGAAMSLGWKAELCGESDSVSAAIMGSYEEQGCKYCDAADCQEKCDNTQQCTTVEGGGTLSYTKSKFFGVDTKPKSAAFSINFKCGATVAGTVSVAATGKEVSGEPTCMDCVDCLTAGVSVNGSLSASAGCELGVSVGPVDFSVGLPNVGSATLSVYGGAQGDIAGDCPFSGCPYLGVKGELKASTQCIPLSFLFTTTDVQCRLDTSACAEANCSTCTCNNCADATFHASCGVVSCGG